ncbi:MAG: class I SAM-dependent methyltransferase [Candidatus Limnocylindria bacterium]
MARISQAAKADLAKQRIRDQWNEMAPRWHAWTPLMRDQYRAATELMLDLASLRPGDRVLDVASGDGYQAIAAALRVGRDGHVLATDLAAEQLRYAAAAARKAGLNNVETRIMDAEDLEFADGSFDAVLCHFGLMFFPRPDRGLKEMWRVLKRRRRAALVVFAVDGAPESDVAASVVLSRLARKRPVAQGSRRLSMGSPPVLRNMLKRAGFREVEIHRHTCPLRLPSVSDAMRYLREIHPSLDKMMLSLGIDEREQVWRQVERDLRRFETEEGFESQNRVLVASGVRP